MCPHRPSAVAHTSAVHGSLSSQSVSALQRRSTDGPEPPPSPSPSPSPPGPLTPTESTQLPSMQSPTPRGDAASHSALLVQGVSDSSQPMRPVSTQSPKAWVQTLRRQPLLFPQSVLELHVPMSGGSGFVGCPGSPGSSPPPESEQPRRGT